MKPVFIAFCHRCSQRLCNRSIQTLQEDQSVKIGVIDPAKLIAEAVRGKFKSTGNEADKSCDLGLAMLLHALNQIVDVCFNSLVDIGIPYGVGLMKNRYIGRTFIQPTQKERENSVKIKLNAIESTVRGKRVILVDDSIVRGTTSKRVVKILREAGATEVHMRVASPPYTNKCYFGTDNTEKRNLIAARTNVEGIREELGLDSIAFLPLEDMLKVAPDANCGFCIGCFTGEYPVSIEKAKEVDKYSEKL